MRHSKTWLATSVCVLCGITLLAMAATRPWTHADVELAVDQFNFEAGESASDLLAGAHFNHVLLTNFDRIEALSPGAITGPGKHSERLVLETQGMLPGISVADVSVASLSYPEHTKLTLATPAPGTLKLTADRPLSIVFTAGKQLLISCRSCKVASDQSIYAGDWRVTTLGSSAQQFRATTSRRPPILGLEMRNFNELDVKDIAVSAAAFESLRNGQPVSSVKSGKVNLPSLKDSSFDLLPDVFVRFQEARNLRIRMLKPQQPLALRITGEFRDLTVGDNDGLRNRIPTLLQQVYQNQTWLIYLTAFFTVTSGIWSLLRMLGKVPE